MSTPPPIETPTGPVIHAIDLRLSYGDCDPAGIVYFAAYYPWFERTYNEWAFLGGFSPSRMHELWGATHISVASGCRYHVPGRLHDALRCEMRLGRLGTTSFSPHFSIVERATGDLFAEGTMTFVFVDQENLYDDERPRPVRVPHQLREILAAAGYPT